MINESIIYPFSQSAETKVFFSDSTDFEELNLQKNTTYFFVDSHVYKMYFKWFDGKNIIEIPSGESSKSWDFTAKILQQLLELGADQHALFVGVGGGVVTDFTGFIASIYKRGVRHAFIPTTLLAMIDASFGGKNGINYQGIKNVLGTVKQPEWIWLRPDWINTLPDLEWQQGFAEIIKHAVIRDAPMFEMLEEKKIDQFKNSNILCKELVKSNIGIKMKLVLADEKDQGTRRLLNFGHTIGHAIEQVHQISHGHAVSMGMIFESDLSVSMGFIDESITHQIQQLLNQYHLPTQMKLHAIDCWEKILHDKKRTSDQIHWVIPENIGKATLKSIPLSELEYHFFKLFS
jgi:3-dehydroquinate synthase